MSSLAAALETPKQTESVTTISAIARIDYILRFSKQTVMVIDEDTAICSNLGHQFLSNLSSEQNAAYITMSPKFNDLQVRCRLIEQLFGHALFDPEQSVAVSLINLVKKHQQAVSIVVENAQHLSLQLVHELCQLSEIAKKSDYKISIVLLSTPHGGMKVNQNQPMFHKKLSIISAQTGQLISHNAKLFKPESDLFLLTPLKKWMIFFLILALVSMVGVHFLLQRDVLGFSHEINNVAQTPNDEIEQFVKAIATNKTIQAVTEGATKESIVGEQATASDVYALLTNSNEEKKGDVGHIQKVSEKAKPAEIFTTIEKTTLMESGIEQAINVEKKEVMLINGKKQKLTEDLSKNAEPTVIKTKQTADLSSSSKETYYQSKQGYVIQIAAFSDERILAEFVESFKQLNLYRYKRLVNNKVMTILTTQAYDFREQANDAFLQLPQLIKDRSPWIKKISAINSEINDYQRSQSKENSVTIAPS